MKKQDITIIIPTYNRCPYPAKEYYNNPLVWCIFSLIEGNKTEIAKIVIIDDGSTDRTEENVQKIKKRYGNVNIVYIRQKNIKNPSISRNLGLRYVESKYVFFMDDDCIIYSGALNKARMLYEYLDERLAMGALHFPVYLRKDFFDGKISEKKIGKLIPDKGEVFSNFRMYPLEKLEKIRIDEKNELNAPIKIDFFHEVFLIKSDLMKKVGGFCEKIQLDHIFSEGLFLSLKLRKYRVQHFQLVDPQCGVIHFRYGSRWNMNIEEKYKNQYPIHNINISLNEMIQKSNLENLNTGGRANAQEIIKESISGRYAVFLYLNEKGSQEWKKYCYDALINGKDPKKMLKFPDLNIDLSEKTELFEKAIEQGRTIYEQRLF